MNTSRGLALAAVAAAVALTASGGPKVRAADISDLSSAYQGRAHHTTLPGAEDTSLNFSFSAQPNGKFQGLVSGILPLQGKVTSTGKVTFTGSGPVLNGNAQITKGKAQLSATGQFLVGSFTLKLTGPQAIQSGNYTFSVQDDEAFAPTGPALLRN